jgi:hypothetical protein
MIKGGSSPPLCSLFNAAPPVIHPREKIEGADLGAALPPVESLARRTFSGRQLGTAPTEHLGLIRQVSALSVHFSERYGLSNRCLQELVETLRFFLFSLRCEGQET